MRNFLSAPLATASSCTFGFSISDAAGDLWSGTLSRSSTLAAAEEAMALTGPPAEPPAGLPPDSVGGAAGAVIVGIFVDFGGMVMSSPHVGHLICSPAPSASTDNSCSQ